MEAFVIKNNNGWFNIIAYNDGWFVWECDITEGWSAAITVLSEKMMLIPPPETINPEWLESPFELEEYSDPMDLEGVSVEQAVAYSDTYLGGE